MAVPALVQRIDYPVFNSGSSITDLFGTGHLKFHFKNNSPGGNCIIVAIQWGDTTTTWSISDDQGNSYTSQINTSDSGNGNSLQIWTTFNCATGTSVISLVNSSGALPNHTAGVAAEFLNIATASALDGTPVTGQSTGTSIACTTPNAGAITTTAANSLVFQFGFSEAGVYTTSFTAGASGGWVLGGADRMDVTDSHAWQWTVQTSAGAITPSFTFAPSGAFLTGALALKSAAAGNSLGSGIVITDMQGNSNNFSSGQASPFTIQFPCPTTTNLLIGVWIGTSGDLNSVSGTISGAWTSAQASNGTQGASGVVHIYYKAGTSGSLTGPTEKLTLTTANATSAGDTFNTYAVQGAAASPFDLATATTGSQATNAQFNIVSITPTTSNGLIVACVGVESGSIDPTSFTPGFWCPPDENNCWGTYYNVGAALAQFQVQPLTGVAAPGPWASQAASFKAAITTITEPLVGISVF